MAPPQHTDIFQRYSNYKCPVNATDHTGKAVFEINPVDSAVVRLRSA